MVRILSWTLGIYGPDLLAIHEVTEKLNSRAFNTLLSPTNLTVVCHRRFPDEISSVIHHLSKLMPLTFQLPLTESNGHE